MFAKFSASVLTITWVLANGRTDKPEIETLVVPALGREAVLGQLYDARRAHFSEINIFKQEQVQRFAKHSKPNTSFVKVSKEHNNYAVFNILDMDESSKLDLLADLVELPEHISWLPLMHIEYNQRWDAIVWMRSVADYEEIDVNDRTAKDLINETLISDVAVSDATHVVVGVERGGDVVMTTRFDNKSIASQLDSMVAAVSDQADTNTTDYWTRQMSNVTVAHAGDIKLNLSTNDPVSLVIELKKLQKSDSNAHITLKYTMMPIDELLVNRTTNFTMAHLNTSLVNEFVKLTDSVIDQTVRAIHWKCIDNFSSYNDDKLSLFLDRYSNKLIDFIDDSKSKLANLLIKVRAGEENPDRLINFFEEAKSKFHNELDKSRFEENVDLLKSYSNGNLDKVCPPL